MGKFILAYPGTLIIWDSMEAAVKNRTLEEREQQIALYEVKQVRLLATDPPEVEEKTPREERLDILKQEAEDLQRRVEEEYDDDDPEGTTA